MTDAVANCPKCGDGSMLGPRYVAGVPFYSYDVEHLAYTCDACGYVERRPCADAARAVAVTDMQPGYDPLRKETP